MGLRLGDIAPNFTAETTEGTIDFHQWLGNGWGILFSHPADYTPVCTTELGATAKLKAQFDARNVKVVALSVDGLEFPISMKHNIPRSISQSLPMRIAKWLNCTT
jgi:thioredoxin-dependent peroxiredoxin